MALVNLHSITRLTFRFLAPRARPWLNLRLSRKPIHSDSVAVPVPVWPMFALTSRDIQISHSVRHALSQSSARTYSSNSFRFKSRRSLVMYIPVGIGIFVGTSIGFYKFIIASPHEVFCQSVSNNGTSKSNSNDGRKPEPGTHLQGQASAVDNGNATLGFASKIEQATDLLQQVKDEVGAPGLVVAVSVNGQLVWQRGFGYADVENRVPCNERTSMRIASISKSMAMAMAGRLIEDGRLDLDKPVQSYVPSWPNKEYDGEPVTITTRHLISHMGGVRHYEKCEGLTKEKVKKDNKSSQEKESSKKNTKQNKDKNSVSSEFDSKEYHIKDHYENVTDALNLFKDDALCSKPGTKFLYTTHGWTLVSAVLEGASGKKFPEMARQMFTELGLHNTKLDENAPLIYNRSRYYQRDKRGRLTNAPYVDNSYKWAGGGFVSTVTDLVQFGNSMLYSYQQPATTTCSNHDRPIGYLRPETMKMFWSPVGNTKCSWDKNGAYGMGWGVVPAKSRYVHGEKVRFYTTHTGGAIGASSALVILPTDGSEMSESPECAQGIVVALITNLESVGLNRVGCKIAKLFEE